MAAGRQPQRSSIRRKQRRSWKHIGAIIGRLHIEGTQYPEAVAISANYLSKHDDKVMRMVHGRNYREALARLLAWQLSGAAAAYKTKKLRPPESVAALLVLPSVQKQFVARLAGPLAGGGLRRDPAAAIRLLGRLPTDPFGMKFYLRPDGGVYSQGLERMELIRLLGALNPYLGRLGEVRGRPAGHLREFLGFLEAERAAGRLPSGIAELVGRPARLPPHPMGPGRWEKMKRDEQGLLVMPPGPDAHKLFSAELEMPRPPQE